MSSILFKRTKWTYSIIIGLAVTTYIIRWLSGQFSFELNNILFVSSLVLLSVTWEALRGVNIYLDKIFPFERNIAARIAIQISIGVVLALLIRFVIYEFGEPILPFTLDSLFLAATWIIYLLLTVGINTIFFIQFFISKWKDSIVETERLEKEKSRVQFDNLKNQLNPHFLFNSLTSLDSLITEDQLLASKFLQHLSKVYRYVLQNKDKSTVPLKTELDFIRNYVFLLETRFKNALSINFNIDEERDDKLIVPVTLQILIENAVKHNIVDINRVLVIDVLTSGDYLVVSNNLQKRSIVEGSNKMGLDNLRSLYGFLTDRQVLVEQTDERFYVKVPLL